MTEFKNVAVVGLGLIGGSMCKTITNRTERRVYGYNRTVKVCEDAKAEGAINGILEIDAPVNEMDLFILCLYPDTCIEFVKTHLADIKRGAVIVDCCGTKRKICDALYELCKQNGVIFIGGHPMAGIEKSGYSYSFDGMFNNASMILCKLNNEENDSSKAGRKAGDKTENTEYRTSVSADDYQASYNEAYASLKDFILKLGFGFVKESTPDEHDRVIAYTSQMAHVVSNAYIKNETCKERYGFSAGSFKDLTRVAFLNEHMWTELFLENRDALLDELEELMGHLQEYCDALESRDEEMLCKLLRDGRIAKTEDMEKEEHAKSICHPQSEKN